MENREPLPSLIATLSQYEKGRGVFDKTLDAELVKASREVVRERKQQTPYKQETLHDHHFDFGSSKERKEINSFAEYTRQYQSQGEQVHEFSQSAPGRPRGHENMTRSSGVATTDDMPEYIKNFKKEWEYVTENRIKLPMIRQLSPRSRKKASLLPPPNALDLKKLEDFQSISDERAPPTLYSDLKDSAIKDQVRLMKKGVFTMQDSRSQSSSSTKKNKYTDGDGTPIANFESTAYFDNVRARQVRQKRQESRVKLIAPGDDVVSEADSMPAVRPPSPKIMSYPFQTSLTDFLRRDQAKGDKTRSRAGSEYSLLSQDSEANGKMARTRAQQSRPKKLTENYPDGKDTDEDDDVSIMSKASDLSSICSSSTKRSVKKSVGGKLSDRRLLDPLHPPHDTATLTNAYTPVLDEVTAAANDALLSYDSVAHSYDQDRQQNYRKQRDAEAFMGQWKTSLLEEIGLDIDPAHNIRVKYGKAITLVMYYLVMVKLKYAVAIWKSFTTKTTKVRREKAASLITRVCRGMLARRMVDEMRINRQRQREAEEEHARQRKAFQSYMSRKIARAWWRHKRWEAKKLKRRRFEAARTIQRRARGIIGRAYAVWYRIFTEKCKYSATKIQSIWRMYKAKRRVTLVRKLEYVRQWELSRAEKLFLKRMDYRHHGAALTMSRAYRAHTIHLRMRELLYWNRFKLALKIQCVYRGYVVRKLYHRLALAKRKKEEERNRAATLIQSQVRLRIALKMYHVMTAGRRERDERRKRRKKKKLRDLVINFSEDKRWNISATNRGIRRNIRSMMPFRYVFERVKARTIQRYYRGYRARKRTLVLNVQMKVNAVYAKREHREKSATKIQKVYRGHRRRHTMRKEVWRRMATTIQCYWRRRSAKRVVNKMKEKIIAREILSDKLCAVVIGNRVRKRYKLEKMYRTYVRRIQRLARKYIGRVYRRDLKDMLRVRAEGSGSASLTTLRVMTAIQLMILKECMGREIGIKPRPVSGVLCSCYGPPQALFVAALGKKGRSDPDLLSSNRLDTTSAQKLISKVEALYSLDKREREKRSKEERAMLKPVSADSSALMVLKAIKVGIIAMPPVVKQLVASDVDIMFNRFKGTAGGNQLLFSEFSEFLGGIGEFAFKKIKLSRTISHADSILDESFVVSEMAKMETKSSGPAVLLRQTSSLGIPRQESRQTSRPNTQQKKKGKLNTGQQRIGIRAAIVKYLFHPENLTANVESLGLAVLLYIMMATEREEWVAGVSDWLSIEGQARVSAIIVPIQQMVRMKLAYVRVRRRRAEKEEEDRIYSMQNGVRAVQRVMLARIHWLRAVRIAQTIIVKYVPHKGEPYWYNPRTGVSSYNKPKILGSFDCIEISLPAPKMDYVVMCGTCEVETATVNCDECEDSMCKSCFATMHCKGKKRSHTYQLIQFCSVCKYQNATKSCATCSLRKPKKRSVMELIKGDRGIQCDACYIHLHENTIASETGAKKNTTGALRDGSKEAYLVGQALNQRLDTDHRYQSLVQVCEECNWRAATYRCADCDQIYCNKCLTGFHSMGGPFSKHSAEKLPYYTPDMHKKFERAMFEQRLQKRIEKVSQLYARRAHEKRVRSAIQIQSWWRMVVGGCKGRAYMKEKRLKIRKMARLRKYEDYTYRRTLTYQIKNVFGFTPKLASDTLEEKILGRHNVFIRQRLRGYIWRNCDDWGYMHNFSKRRGDEEPIPKERKGEPRVGFNCGTPKELADQAKRGGYRLPGTIMMKRGEKEQTLSMDISPLLKRGQYIRIKNCFFVINSVGKNNTVTFNRRWRFKDAKNCRIYLMPCYPGEKYKWFYKGRIMLFDAVTGNVLSQYALQAYQYIWRSASDKCSAIATSNKRIGLMVSAKKWTKRSTKYHDKAMWASNLIYEDGAPDTASLETGGKTTTGGKSRRPEDRVPGEPWEATEDEKNLRYMVEMKMSRADLAAEAPLWEENFDALKNKKYWIHAETLEMTYDIPKAVSTKTEMDAEAEAKRKEFAETQRKIARLAKEKAAKKTLGKKKR